MAFPTAVNSQITDSVTQASVNVLGDAPAVAMGNLYQTAAAAAGQAIQNAVTSQQNLNVLAEAVITASVKSLIEGPAVT
ncbi:MAG: glycerol-3-phosphate dehydrogenase [bacterium]|nr:glycerol-3-phosphate dehydrogenase [bacterium]